MKLGIRNLFRRIFNFLFPPADPNLVTVQNVYGNLVEVKIELLFRPLHQLVEDGTEERTELMKALTNMFGGNSNMVVGEVIQEIPFEFENFGMTLGQITILQEILTKVGLTLGTEIYRPTWQELIDEVNHDLEKRSDRSPMGRSGPTE